MLDFTQVHACMHTRPSLRVHTYIPVCPHILACMYKRHCLLHLNLSQPANSHVHACMYIHPYLNAHTCKPACTHIHACIHSGPCLHPHTSMLPCTHKPCLHEHTSILACTHIHACMHTHPCLHAHTSMLVACKHVHACMHTIPCLRAHMLSPSAVEGPRVDRKDQKVVHPVTMGCWRTLQW